MHLRRALTALTALTILATAGAVAVAAPASADVEQDRAQNAVDTLISRYYDASTGEHRTPTGEAWQPGLGIDAIINVYERTRDDRYLTVLQKSFDRYVGRRSYYYDDDGWYLNAWLRAYDVTGQTKFLDEAKSLFQGMTRGWDDTCGGGVWWSQDRGYKNAIPNELFLLAAARLARRAPNGTGSGSYHDWMMREWNWFRDSGMINSSQRVNDGLDGSCRNNGETPWSYNQGVILGALVEMWRITSDRGYLYQAEQIAEATLSTNPPSTAVGSPGGILRDPCEPDCSNGDVRIFKGVFVQGLARLYTADPGNKPAYGTYLRNNADAVWANDRDGTGTLGLVWQGPGGTFDYATHAAASLLLTEVSLLAIGGETSTVPTPPVVLTYEAEDAAHRGISTESVYSGYSGTGYLAGWNANATVDFAISVPTARTYRLTFRYAAGAGDAYRYVDVNGSSVSSRLLFADSGAWGNYRTASVDASLRAGANTVTVGFDSGRSSSNWVNLDKLDVS